MKRDPKPKLKLTEEQRATIYNGLATAASLYEKHAQTLREEAKATKNPVFGDLAGTFTMQMQQARIVAGIIQDAEEVEVTPHEEG